MTAAGSWRSDPKPLPSKGAIDFLTVHGTHGHAPKTFKAVRLLSLAWCALKQFVLSKSCSLS